MANRTAVTPQSQSRAGYPTGSNSDDPAQIRAEIEQTRARMGQTIDQIQERLSPARLKQQTKDTIRDATIGKVEEMTNRAEYEVKSWRSKIVQTVKDNPVPAALIGVGLGWLIMADSDNNHDNYSYDDYRQRPYSGAAPTTRRPPATRAAAKLSTPPAIVLATWFKRAGSASTRRWMRCVIGPAKQSTPCRSASARPLNRCGTRLKKHVTRRRKRSLTSGFRHSKGCGRPSAPSGPR